MRKIGSISVVVPTYNGAGYCEEAMSSIFGQTVLPAEVIVVDDDSTDGCREVVARLARSAPVPVRLHRLRRNSGGPATPMNTGMRLSSSDVVALLDQDDVMRPGKLESSLELLNRYPECGLVFGQYTVLDFRGIERHHPSSFYACFPNEPSRLSAAFMLESLVADGYRLGGAGGTVIRKSAWSQLRGFDPQFRICWDYDFAMRLALRGVPFAYSPTVVYRHREHEQNLNKAGRGMLAFCEHHRALVKLWRQPAVPHLVRKWLRAKLVAELVNLGFWERRLGNYLRAVDAYWLAVQLSTNVAVSLLGIARSAVEALCRPFARVPCT